MFLNGLKYRTSLAPAPTFVDIYFILCCRLLFLYKCILRNSELIEASKVHMLTLLWRRPLSHRNQSINLLCKSMDWFLYDNGLRHEGVKYLIMVKNKVDWIIPGILLRFYPEILSRFYPAVFLWCGILNCFVLFPLLKSDLIVVSSSSAF